jgi:hypothetical protein
MLFILSCFKTLKIIVIYIFTLYMYCRVNSQEVVKFNNIYETWSKILGTYDRYLDIWFKFC